MEITKREIIASISIIAILFTIGLLISGKITENKLQKNEIYNTAIKIDDTELFKHGMNTNIGNAFVYGELKAVDTVSYPEIGGEYMYVEKVKEKYTKHKRTVTKKVNGKTVTHVETYWTWDYVSTESMECKEIKFCGVKFKTDKINFLSLKII